MAQNKNIDTYIKIGVIIGAYFLVVKPLLEKLGIQKTPAQEDEDKKKDEKKKQAEFLQISPQSAFSPTFWKTVSGAHLIKSQYAKSLAKILHDSINGSLLGDDIGAIYKVFRSLTYKTQVSWLAKIYGDLYNSELLNDLKNGAKYAASVWNFRAGLNDEEMNVIYGIVENLK